MQFLADRFRASGKFHIRSEVRIRQARFYGETPCKPFTYRQTERQRLFMVYVHHLSGTSLQIRYAILKDKFLPIRHFHYPVRHSGKVYPSAGNAETLSVLKQPAFIHAASRNQSARISYCQSDRPAARLLPLRSANRQMQFVPAGWAAALNLFRTLLFRYHFFCCFLICLCRLRSTFLYVSSLNFRLCTQRLDDRFPFRFICGIQLLRQQGTPVCIRWQLLLLCAITGFCYLCPYRRRLLLRQLVRHGSQCRCSRIPHLLSHRALEQPYTHRRHRNEQCRSRSYSPAAERYNPPSSGYRRLRSGQILLKPFPTGNGQRFGIIVQPFLYLSHPQFIFHTFLHLCVSFHPLLHFGSQSGFGTYQL